MTAGELSGYTEGAALAAYLSQPDASASVCDPRSAGPRFLQIDEEARKALAGAFRDGTIAPQLWRRCMAALLRGSAPSVAAALLGDVLQASREAIEDRNLEFDAGRQVRLDALQQVYAERDPGLVSPPALANDIASALRRDLERKRLGPTGERRAADLFTLLELERGRWQDRAVDGPALDDLLGAGDERTLRWAVDRLPDAALRAEARRRIVRLHLRASPLPEVRGEAAAVEETVMRTGANPVSLDRYPPLRGWIDPALGSARAVLVEQHLAEQSARLLGYTSERPTPSVLPELPSRGSLHVSLKGISIPLTVCAPAGEMDVTPCLAAADLRVDSPLATVDGEGVLHFADYLGEAAAVSLAYQGRLVLPFDVGGRRVAALEWLLAFQAPEDLVLAGAGAGAAGPDLDVRIDGRAPSRLVYSVSDGRRQYQAVVERQDAASFHVVTRGAAGQPGASGSPGSNGSSGMDGQSAVCPSVPGSSGSPGADGSRGGDGGAGGPGGAGGDIRVSVVAAPEARDGILAVLRAAVRSEGGPGGPGGQGGLGGSGGSGGRGGWGATCTDADGHVFTLPGGSDGPGGSNGWPGANGPAGPPGRPGRVTFSSAT